MHIEQLTYTTTRVRQTKIEHAVVGRHHQIGTIYAVRETVTDTTVKGDVTCKPSVTVKEYLVDDAGLARVKEGLKVVGPKVLHDPKDPEDYGVIVMVGPDFEADYLKSGHKGFGIVHNPLSMAESGAYMLVEGYGRANLAFDMQGAAYSRPMYLDYCLGLDNKHYDLRLAVQILGADPRVELLPKGGERCGEGFIGDIPSYNAEKGCDRCIAVVLRLPRDQFQAVWNGVSDSRGSSQRLIDSDLLGLIAGGAAKYSDYYGHDRNPLYKGKTHPVGCYCTACGGGDEGDGDEGDQ